MSSELRLCPGASFLNSFCLFHLSRCVSSCVCVCVRPHRYPTQRQLIIDFCTSVCKTRTLRLPRCPRSAHSFFFFFFLFLLSFSIDSPLIAKPNGKCQGKPISNGRVRQMGEDRESATLRLEFPAAVIKSLQVAAIVPKSEIEIMSSKVNLLTLSLSFQLSICLSVYIFF